MADPPRDLPSDATTEGVQDSIAPGTLVAGRYRLATPVSRTIDAWVVNAIDERSRRRVRLRFSSRAPAASRLDVPHPALPNVLGHGVTGPEVGAGHHWVALDWFDGGPLTLDAVPAPASRTRRRAVTVAILGLLEGLAWLDEVAGSHGALSRASLWLGEDGRLRIIDATAPPLKPAGGPTWATPEGLRGLPRSSRTDVYAVASLLVGWQQGRPPFGSDPARARAGHLMRPLPEVPALDGPLRVVLSRALHKRPEERYPDPGAFREALAEALRAVEPVALPLMGAMTHPVGTPVPPHLDLPRMAVAPPGPMPNADRSRAPLPEHTIDPDPVEPQIEAAASATPERWIRAGLLFAFVVAGAGLVALGIAAVTAFVAGGGF